MRARYFFIFLFILSVACGSVWSQGVDAQMAKAEQAFKEQRFSESMNLMEEIYAQGQFSELMLYRLAFMKEQLKDYPMAIYYLKKAAKEFGNPSVDAKVKQLMQLQGSDRFYPSSAWNTYLQFFREWGWLIWGLFGLAALIVIVDPFLKFYRGHSTRKVVLAGAWTLSLMLALVLGHRSFFVPKLAVLTQQTSFYDFPSYAAKNTPKAFSLGETVSIEGEEDIWQMVSTGDKTYWVPKRTLKEL